MRAVIHGWLLCMLFLQVPEGGLVRREEFYQAALASAEDLDEDDDVSARVCVKETERQR